MASTARLILLVCSLAVTVKSFGTPSPRTLTSPPRVEVSPAVSNALATHLQLPRPAVIRPVRMVDASGEADSSTNNDLVTKRRKRVEVGYSSSYLAWGTISAIIFFRAAKALATPTATAQSTALAGYMLTTRLLVTTAVYIERGATIHNRLSSDTYRRLNVGLLGHSMLGLVASSLLFWGNAGKSAVTALLAAASFLTAVPSFKGWWYGVRGWDTSRDGGVGAMSSDMLKIVTSSIRGFFRFANAKAALYLVVAWFAACLKATKIYQIGTIVAQAGGGSASLTTELASRIINLSNIALFSLITYTLKDAADRGRLEGTTFIELNFASCAVFVALAAHLTTEGAALPLSVASSAMGAFTGGNGLFSLWKKRSEI